MTREEAIEISRKYHKKNWRPVKGEPIITIQHGRHWLILWETEPPLTDKDKSRQSGLLKAFMKGVRSGYTNAK